MTDPKVREHLIDVLEKALPPYLLDYSGYGYVADDIFAAGYVPASEVQRAREEALRLRLSLSAVRASLGCPDEVDGCDRHIYHEYAVEAIRAEIDGALAGADPSVATVSADAIRAVLEGRLIGAPADVNLHNMVDRLSALLPKPAPQEESHDG